MNGSRFLLDTNALIALDSNAELRQNLKNATWIGTSIICIIEYLSFDKLSSEQKNSFLEVVKEIEIIDLKFSDIDLLNLITQIRTSTNLKLPDAIIVASAASNDAVILTRDKQLLNNPNFKSQDY